MVSCSDWKEARVPPLTFELPVVVLPKKHRAEQQGIKSTQSKVETTITFVNRSKQTIKVFWLDYEGKRQFKEAVKDGDSYTSQRTYLTHPWLITDKDENAWDIYFPDAQPRTVEIFGPSASAREAKNQDPLPSNLASSLVRREEAIPTGGPWGEWHRYLLIGDNYSSPLTTIKNHHQAGSHTLRRGGNDN
jgi:hypothetical protein